MSDKTHKILASIGTLLALLIPLIAASQFAHNPAVLLGCTLASNVLAFFGFTIVKPLNAASSDEAGK